MTDPFKFDRFRYDPLRNALYRDGVPVPVGGRAIRLLGALLRRRGDVVTKAALIDATWQAQAVEESNLSVQVAQLRKILGSHWIRTVERVGYGFMAEPAATVAVWRPPALAVRPFAGAESLSDALIERLTRFGSLTVLAVPADGERADYLAEGKVRHESGRLSFSVRLIACRDGAYQWAERFFLPVSAAARVHDRLADRIAAAVEDQIERAEIDRSLRHSPESFAASDVFRRAQAHLRTSRPHDFAIASMLMEQALAREPENVSYLALMCEALQHPIAMGWPVADQGWVQRCLDYATRGLEQPRIDGQARTFFGVGLFRAGDPDRGHALMQQAAGMNPSSLVSLIYAATSNMHWGSIEVAEAQYRRALRLVPLAPAQAFVTGGLARIRMMKGDYTDALNWAARAIRVNPNFGAAHWTMIAATAQLGNHDEALRCLMRFGAVQPGVTVAAIRAGQPTRRSRMDSTLDGLAKTGLAER